MEFRLDLPCLLHSVLVEHERHSRNASGVFTVRKRRCSAIGGFPHIGMMKNVILEILYGTLTAYKKKSVLIVQHTHFVRCHKLTPCELVVGRVASVSPARSTVSVRVNGLLAKQLRDIFVGGLLVTAEIEKLVTVADDAFPLLLKQGFELRQILNDD